MAGLIEAVHGRELSYASSAQTRKGRALVRLIENATGRRKLLRRAQGYEAELASGAPFFEVMARRYGLTPEVTAGSLAHIPRKGPLIVVANHPFGILDGLLLGALLTQTRDSFKIMANSVFARAPDLADRLLPIEFAATKDALARNIATRRDALGYLAQGGAIGIFPGGTVSTGLTPFARPADPEWRSFTARMIAKSDATVVPIYFEGETSRMFQIASHININLRLGLLIREFGTRIDTPVRLAIGRPLGRDILEPMARDAKAMMDFLRKATYELASEPLDSFAAGYDFGRPAHKPVRRVWQ